MDHVDQLDRATDERLSYTMTRPKGQEHHRSLLTDAEVDALRELHEEGWTLGQLAEKFEISKTHAFRIVWCETRAGGKTPRAPLVGEGMILRLRAMAVGDTFTVPLSWSIPSLRALAHRLRPKRFSVVAGTCRRVA